MEAIVKDEAKNNIPQARKPKKSKWLTKEAIYIADKRREAKKDKHIRTKFASKTQNVNVRLE